ncbi:metal-dependent hydrolase [Nocardia amamiensis]|uniref:Metal-dependent hydrolase n=1 Tax=Nocardia amamiensis TaxID=404578 RepID=A0ABS0CS96_9NOCA|nr:metal-dependent hydrolase [Nocardia amamiensis]MBF6299487.1 metal-dependent hydrolase [Nocardia amamiensis]
MKLLRRAGRRPDTDPGPVALHARNVRFDWAGTPLHWMPAEPIASHLINSLNLLLPEGERMFCAAYAEALPYVRDDKLREAMLGFIGQESMHAETHDKVLHEVLAAHGIDPGRYLRHAEYLFRRTLGPGDADGVARRQVLIERLAFIACLEHFFAYLGDWVLNADLERFHADPRMADLFRWHGAEEVEHRHVAHDVAVYFGAGYLRRAGLMTLVFPIFLTLVLRGTKFLIHQDPELPDLGYPRLLTRVFGAMWRGALPGVPSLLWSALSTFKPGYHPDSVGSTAQAVAYLAKSPAAQAIAS